MINSQVSFMIWLKKLDLSEQIKLQTKTETSATTQNVETLINLQALENEQVKPDFQCGNIVLWVT